MQHKLQALLANFWIRKLLLFTVILPVVFPIAMITVIFAPRSYVDRIWRNFDVVQELKPGAPDANTRS